MRAKVVSVIAVILAYLGFLGWNMKQWLTGFGRLSETSPGERAVMVLSLISMEVVLLIAAISFCLWLWKEKD